MDLQNKTIMIIGNFKKLFIILIWCVNRNCYFPSFSFSSPDLLKHFDIILANSGLKNQAFDREKRFVLTKQSMQIYTDGLIKTKMALKSWLYWCIGVRNQIAFEYFPLIHSSTWLTTLSIIIILRIDAAEILYLHKWPDFRLPLYSFLMKKEHDILEQKRDAC